MNRPRPVLTTNGVVGAVTGVAAVLAFLGYANVADNISGEAQGIASAVVFLVPLLSHLVAGIHAQDKVTPVSAPQDATGMPLIAAHQVVPVPQYIDVPRIDSDAPSGSDLPTVADPGVDVDQALADADAIFSTHTAEHSAP